MKKITILLKETIMAQDKEFLENDIDWENRVLCSDGNCIGVIGTDGRCKECGLKPDQSGEKIFMDTDENDNLDSSDIKDQPDSLEIDDTSPDKDADWEDRVLCSDETCIGTIGPGGTCNECGKPHS